MPERRKKLAEAVRRQEKKGKIKGKEKIEKEGFYGHLIFPMYSKRLSETVLPKVFQNGFNSIRKAAPSEELEPEPFLKKPELCQTDPK